ncbi:type II methionyl aminopeptidase [Candidatus Pacearchaeota archaeon]|nr:type II methionyl aminopeptidase [Candidatus Pacearchaeota archaeon]|tara:strand:+ start:1016 stop:1906 length:891 start_codon:yes stop_codon:yes gene_type:complete
MEQKEIEAYRKAGEMAKKVVAYARGIIKPGMLLIEIADKIDAKIEEVGGVAAFPVNLSLNEIAAHYTPSSDDKTKAEGLLKVDLGVSVDGYIADVAFSLDLTDDSRFKDMIEMNEAVLENVLAKLNVDSEVKDIGNAIQEKLSKSGDGYSVVRNLSGHLLGKDVIHAGLTISNYENDNKTKIKDMAIAIEPFLTSGVGKVYNGKDSEIFRLKGEQQVRDKDAREILKFIKENYKTRPFCKRWLEKEGFKKLNFVLKLLVRDGILHNYSMLIEKSKKPVSQAEHTVLIHDEVEVVTR